MIFFVIYFHMLIVTKHCGKNTNEKCNRKTRKQWPNMYRAKYCLLKENQKGSDIPEKSYEPSLEKFGRTLLILGHFGSFWVKIGRNRVLTERIGASLPLPPALTYDLH